MDKLIKVERVDGEDTPQSIVVDSEIEEFNSWYLDKFTGQQPLTKYERAILKTYIMHKLAEA